MRSVRLLSPDKEAETSNRHPGFDSGYLADDIENGGGNKVAWISVDQKLIGGKLRSLYKSIGCSQYEAMGILVFLWLWGIDNADMDGLIVSADRSDIADALKPGLAPGLDAETVVESLIQNRWIDEADGELYFHDWSEWRSYYNKYIGEKKKHAERMRRYRNKNTESNGESDVPSDGTNDVTPDVTDDVPEPPAEPEKKAPKYEKDFETFWAAYPRKADKGQCYKKYKARLKDGYSPNELLAAATAYADQCRRQRTEPQFIKHGKTFLGDSMSFTEFIPKMNTQPAEAPRQEAGSNPFRR